MMVAITTVAAFETVGSILVIAMLIVPPATAYLLTERLSVMILLSLALATVTGLVGHVAAITVPSWLGYSDTSTAGMMAATAGVLFLVVMVIAPKQGIISRVIHRGALALNVVREDVLGLLYRCEEIPSANRPVLDLRFLRAAVDTPSVVARCALRGLVRDGKLQREQGTFRLTSDGRRQARDLVRTHRLWESYLHRVLQLPADHVHPPAERLEHVTTPAMQAELADHLGPTSTDPHGKTVPRSES